MKDEVRVNYGNISSKEVYAVGRNLIKVGDFILCPHTVTSVGRVFKRAEEVGFYINHLQGRSEILSTDIWVRLGNSRAYDEFMAEEIKEFERMKSEFIALLDAALECKP